MLPRPNRLPATEIRNILRFGHKTPYELFSVAVRRNQKDTSRWAILISKKIAKKATDRNRLRRIFKAAVLKLTPTIGAYDVVVRIQKPAPDMTSKQVLSLLEKACVPYVK